MTTECIGETKVTLAEKLSEYLSAKVPGFSSTEHLDSSFSSLGLDSVSHVEMTAMIEDHLQIKVDPALAFDYPTINSLVNYLQSKFVVVTEVKEQG